ncbi:phospholipase/carboxylesterase family protein-like protein [Dendryphion nanum]|uniref:Phospholipase/carboxylesterase family protein-like protein n=1 Tax=Dendryphion nanum TaxID=256645 RepID=A0A9P9DUA3_9PLEO|nr:phospholipase/carboxylesterase family protein-like protein [Dendryphion nanum]
MAPTTDYPAPLIVPPTSGSHKNTIIILHGRGSTADIFSSPLLTHPVTLHSPSKDQSSSTFQSFFPYTKFVFPTASRRRAVHYNRSFTHQWFDMYPLDTFDSEHKQNVQMKGLKESTEYLHRLLTEETHLVGGQNVILMGLSQGCATSLLSAILWEGENLAAVVGICGWLPLRRDMLEFTAQEDEELLSDDDLFERDDDGQNENRKTRYSQVVEWLREEMDLSSSCGHKERATESLSMQRTPVFLGHGSEDEKVPLALGKLAAEALSVMEIAATFQDYEGLGHWYSANMLRDIINFIKEVEGWDEPVMV